MSKNAIAAVIVVAVIIAAAVIFGAFAGKDADRAAEQNKPLETDTNSEPMAELIIEDIKVGTGKEAKAGDTISVHYVGTFPDGRKFDSSRDRGTPFSFPLGAGMVIKGWDQGVAGMKEGGIRKLTIPPQLGYGMADHGSIPGGSTLLFEVELIEVVN